MTELPKTLRPGVFVNASAQPACAGSLRGGAAVAGQAQAGEPGTAVRLETAADALQFGEGSALCRMASVLLAAGVSPVWAARAADDYEAAYAAFDTLDEVLAVTGDGGTQALLSHVEHCRENGRERIGILPAAEADAPAAAKSANSAHFVVVCGGGAKPEETAAALAAVVALTPAGENLNGAALPLENFDGTLSGERTEALLQAGVTPVERVDGIPCIVRAVTSRTAALGLKTRAFSSLSAALAADDVVRTVRQAVRLRMQGMKNTPVTREGIASQIVVELENKLEQGVIDSYQPPVVRPHPDDPAVCVATLRFRAAPEISQVVIAARILL